MQDSPVTVNTWKHKRYKCQRKTYVWTPGKRRRVGSSLTLVRQIHSSLLPSVFLSLFFSSLPFSSPPYTHFLPLEVAPLKYS